MGDFKKNKDFEFTLYLNDNIIVQRFFDIKGFNKTAINSISFKESIDDSVNIIKEYLRDESIDYMSKHYNEYDEGVNPLFVNNEENDTIKFVVKYNNNNIVYREIDANLYPIKVRHSIDIRRYIYEIISPIQKTLSSNNDKLNFVYMDYDLKN